MSPPVWRRGLKLTASSGAGSAHQSPPVWRRGLKLKRRVVQTVSSPVAARVAAWIEISLGRGVSLSLEVAARVAAWIEIPHMVSPCWMQNVAARVAAWIEIVLFCL